MNDVRHDRRLLNTGLSQSHIDNRASSQKTGDNESGDFIILIDNQAFVRDCISMSLHMCYNNLSVVSLSSVEELATIDIDLMSVAFIMFNLHQRRPSSLDVEQGLKQIKSLCPTAPIIILSDIESVDRVREALDRGAQGFISTSATLDVAVGATRVVSAGGTFVPASSLAVTWSGTPSCDTQGASVSGRFTQRQLAVLHFLRQGKANKTIAYELDMSESTVKVHVRNIMQKLKATNRTEVVFLTRDLFRADAGE